LNSRPLGELKKLAQLMAVPVSNDGEQTRQPNFAGQAPTPTSNTNVETAMEMPVMNWEKK